MHQRSAARLAVSGLRWRRSITALIRAEAVLDRRRLGRPPRRRDLHPVVTSTLPVVVLGADFTLAWVAIQIELDLDERWSAVIAVPLAVSMFLSGRLTAAGVLERRWSSAVVGATVAVIAAGLIASTDHAHAFRFLLALLPAAVSGISAVLAHVEPAEIEVAERALRQARSGERRALRRFERRLAITAGRQATFGIRAAGPLIARPHAGLDGEPAPIPTVDALELIHRLTAIHPANDVEAAFALLDELAGDDRNVSEPSNLRSVA